MSSSNHDWTTIAGVLVGILTTKPLIFYYINVKSPPKSKSENFLSGKRGEGGRDRQREREIDRDRERESKT